MKSILFLLFSLFGISFCAAKTNHIYNTQEEPKRKSTTSSSTDHDDPAKIVAFCAKYGTSDSIYLQIDKGICGDYQLTNIEVTQGDPLFHLLSMRTFAYYDTFYHPISSPPLDGSYYIKIPFQVDEQNAAISSNKLILLTANMTPDSGNDLIECSRTRINIHIYLSEEERREPTIILNTGKCYKCKLNTENKLPEHTYAHFRWETNGSTVTFFNQSVFPPQAKLVFYYGNPENDSIVIPGNPLTPTSLLFTRRAYSASLPLFGLPFPPYTYPANGTFEPELKIFSEGHRNCCIYSTKATIRFSNGLELPNIALNALFQFEEEVVSLDWTLAENNESERKYAIQRREMRENEEWKTLNKTSATTFIDKEVKFGNQYEYQIMDITDEKEMIYSNMAVVNLIDEVVLTTHFVLAENIVRLDWLLKSKGLTPAKYVIKRKEIGKDYEWATIGSTSDITFIDKEVQYGAKYVYQVVSLYEKEEQSIYSNITEIELIDEIILATDFVSKENVILLEWKLNAKVPDNYEYEVQRTELKQQYEWTTIAATTKNSFMDKEIELNNRYYYRVVGSDKEKKGSIYSNIEDVLTEGNNCRMGKNGEEIAHFNNEDEILNSTTFVFPNPTKDKITIFVDAKQSNGKIIALYSINGVRLFEGRYISQEIDMQNYVSGIYILQIGNEWKRIQKE